MIKNNIKKDIILIINAYNDALNHKNINNPKTFNEKISWIKIFDCNDLKINCTDKIKLHDYCKSIIGRDICVPIIKIYNDINDLNYNELPNSFVLKCNHGCGFNLIVKDKKELNFEEIYKKILKYYNTDYSYIGYELQYHYIKRKIFTEKYLGNNILDYKIWCFNGEPKWISVFGNRFCNNKYINHYDLDFNILDIMENESNYSINIKKPYTFDTMLKYSKILSSNFNFVRVDFYEIDNILYLGELTFTPKNGKIKFKNLELDNYYGNLLKI